MPHYRIERDSLGEVRVPADKLWGAQTQRSLEHFSIGDDLIPRELIDAYAILKKAAALANHEGGRLTDEQTRLVVTTCDEILAGRHHDMFPLHVWMTGSGTQFNMNINEVISNRCCELAGTALGSKQPVHPNDHVNMSQSSNDTFPSVMHIATAIAATRSVLPSVAALRDDLRLLSCGPRCGLHELLIPENEPGSSIMPDKVNPTQCEAIAMIAVQVMANDVAVGFGGASGYLEMNVYKPLMIANIMQSLRILADGCRNFREFLIEGTRPNREQINAYVERSLMLVTALSPVIGYDKASRIAHYANDNNLTLKEAALKLGFLSEAEFDRVVDPRKNGPPIRGVNLKE